MSPLPSLVLRTIFDASAIITWVTTSNVKAGGR